MNLYVNNNRIGNEGVIRFSMGKFKRLQKLALGSKSSMVDENKIGDKAMTALTNLDDLV